MLETLSYTKAGSLILYKKECGERQNRSVLAHAVCGWPERERDTEVREGQREGKRKYSYLPLSVPFSSQFPFPVKTKKTHCQYARHNFKHVTYNTITSKLTTRLFLPTVLEAI